MLMHGLGNTEFISLGPKDLGLVCNADIPPVFSVKNIAILLVYSCNNYRRREGNLTN